MRLRRFRHYWNEIGRTDPFTAILTHDGGARASQWDIDQFFATGRRDADQFVAELRRLVPTVRLGRALDFGCGLGRVTRALADHFESVMGVDLASSMIARARTLNAARPRCRFEVNQAPHLRRFPTGSFDVVYSRLVLQHLAPRFVRRYVPELVRVLAPGGVLMFQLPGVLAVDPQEAFCDAPVKGWIKRRLPRPFVRAYRGLKYWVLAEAWPHMEMFGMDREAVVALIRASGALLLQTRPDRSHGTEVSGFEYWVMR